MPRPHLINLGDGLGARVVPGAGDRVLWIHGYTLDSSCWNTLWELLPGWHHIGVDLPGHGISLPLDSSENLAAVAKRIGVLALRHSVRHVIALSFGTLVALQLAIDFPSSFSSIVLGAPAVGGGPQDQEVRKRYEELSSAYLKFGWGPHLRERWMESPPDIFKGAETQPRLWEQLVSIVGRHPWWELRDHSYARLSNYSQTRDLQKIRSRTLILVGDNELAAFKRCGEIIRRAIPNSRRVYVEHVGHLCMLEDPATTSVLIDSHLCAKAPLLTGS